MVVVVKCYDQDEFQQYLSNKYFCLGMIFDCCGTGKQKLVQNGRIKKAHLETKPIFLH